MIDLNKHPWDWLAHAVIMAVPCLVGWLVDKPECGYALGFGLLWGQESTQCYKMEDNGPGCLGELLCWVGYWKKLDRWADIFIPAIINLPWFI